MSDRQGQFELGELRRSRATVEQRVLNGHGAKVVYALRNGHLWAGVHRGWAPLNTDALKERYREQLMAMLTESNQGIFQSDNGIVIGHVSDGRGGSATAFFTRWDADRAHFLSLNNIDRDEAERIALREFHALPESARRRLVEIARQSRC